MSISGDGVSRIVGASGGESDVSDGGASSSPLSSIVQSQACKSLLSSLSSQSLSLSSLDLIATCVDKTLSRVDSGLKSIFRRYGSQKAFLIGKGQLSFEDAVSVAKTSIMEECQKLAMCSYCDARSSLSEDLLGNSEVMEEVTNEIAEGTLGLFKLHFSRFVEVDLPKYVSLYSAAPVSSTDLEVKLGSLFRK